MIFVFLAKSQDWLYSAQIRLFFVSNSLQESIHKTDVLASLCSDHSPILFSLDMIKEDQSLWKFNGLWKEKCGSEITKNEVKDVLGTMMYNRTPGNKGLTCEFYKAFWSELKTPLLSSYKKFFVWRTTYLLKTSRY